MKKKTVYTKQCKTCGYVSRSRDGWEAHKLPAGRFGMEKTCPLAREGHTLRRPS